MWLLFVLCSLHTGNSFTLKMLHLRCLTADVYAVNIVLILSLKCQISCFWGDDNCHTYTISNVEIRLRSMLHQRRNQPIDLPFE